MSKVQTSDSTFACSLQSRDWIVSAAVRKVRVLTNNMPFEDNYFKLSAIQGVQTKLNKIKTLRYKSLLQMIENAFILMGCGGSLSNF